MMSKILSAILFLGLLSSQANGFGIIIDTKLAAAELIGQLMLQYAQFLPLAPQIQPLGLGKRSADTDLEEILERSAALDCGKLLVCALARDEANLTRDEMTILSLFNTDPPSHSGSARAQYQTAAHIGVLSRSQEMGEVCGALYSRCDLDIRELRDLVRTRQ